MQRTFHLLWCLVSVCLLCPDSVLAQAATEADDPPTTANPTWLVRDPLSGRIFRQKLVEVSVPTTRWETKAVKTTVYEPQLVTETVAEQRSIYRPQTDYVMQPRIRGWWNPFRQPVQTYEFVPVTTWRTETQAVRRRVPVQKWVAKEQTVYRLEPVERVETRQQLVMSEVPQHTMGQVGTMLAIRPPLVNWPILAQQRMLPWPSGDRLQVPPPSSSPSGLRPIANGMASVVSGSYQAPLRSASSSNDSSFRDASQAGMAATVLR